MEFVETIGRIAQNYGPGAAAFAVVGILVFRFYLSRWKERNLTTREDYEALFQQLKMTTQETQSIRSELARSSWLVQQQGRETYCTDLLANLGKLKRSLLARSNAYPRGPGLQMQAVAGADAFRRAGTAAVYLSDGAVLPVEQLAREGWHLEYDAASEQGNVERVLELAEKAYVKVLAEARSALVPEEINVARGAPLET